MLLIVNFPITTSWSSTTISVEHCLLQHRGSQMEECLTGTGHNMFKS